jgi:60 kDa SS-A/Ro ribonucleoprotein
MVQNSAGGFAFAIDDWRRLDRFLILGSEGGTYYASENNLTVKNAKCVLRCIKSDGKRVVDKIVDISGSGKAPKNDPALFALAMCAGLGDIETKKAALSVLQNVARIGTHLFHFIAYVEQFRGWGRSLSDAVKFWYQDKDTDFLAYQVVKYQSRDGWSHRDLLRLSHPKPNTELENNLYKWITKNEVLTPIPRLVEGYEKAKEAPRPDVNLITDYGLTREMIPTEWLKYPQVWEALLPKMPITAMIRNLGNMTRVGTLSPMSQLVNNVIETITSKEILKKGRVHPLALLVAITTYSQGHGDKGTNAWTPIAQIVDALGDAFYLAFDTVEPTNQRWLLGLDVSSSMAYTSIAGMAITPRTASAAMALITASVEKQHYIMAFCNHFVPLSISPRQRLDDVTRTIDSLAFGATDCALPMVWALKNKLPVDVFVIYTDNETWYGSIHPCQALDMYRQKMGIPAKMIVVAMSGTQISIADPNDSGMLDVSGFSTDTPMVMSNFARE